MLHSDRRSATDPALLQEFKKDWSQVTGKSVSSFKLNVVKNTHELPDRRPVSWQQSLTDRFSFVFADECQETLRNQNGTWRSVRWLHPLQLTLMSGYPATRGMRDFLTYMQLLKRPSMDKLLHEQQADFNPYEIPDNDPR